MRPAATLVVFRTSLVLAILAAAAAPAAAATEATGAVQVCGTLREHRPATASIPGALTIGTRTYVVAAGTVAGNGGVTVAIGTDLCVQATQGRTSGQLVYYLFFPMLRERVCGNHLASTQTTTTIAADFGELIVRRGSGLPPGQGNERLCYAFEVDRTTGDLVATAALPIRDIDREWLSPCGTIKEYTRATGTGSGSITVGSRSYLIRTGVGYTGDPAGDRTDRTAVGANLCLRGTLGTAGEIVEYLTTSMPTGISVRAAAYTPPSGSQPGLAITSYQSRSTIRIPAAVDAAIDVSRGTYCFNTTVDAAGDMSASAIIPCPQGGVATGPGPTTSSAASPSGAPSAVPSATTSAAATPSPIAAASPAPDSATTTHVPVGPDPLLVAGLLGIAGLGLLAIYLARRRAS